MEAERRQVTVLFADMVGFTTFSERSGEEAAYTLMRSLSKLMGELFASRAVQFKVLLATASWRSLVRQLRSRMRPCERAGRLWRSFKVSKKPGRIWRPSTACDRRCGSASTPAQPW